MSSRPWFFFQVNPSIEKETKVKIQGHVREKGIFKNGADDFHEKQFETKKRSGGKKSKKKSTGSAVFRLLSAIYAKVLRLRVFVIRPALADAFSVLTKEEKKNHYTFLFIFLISSSVIRFTFSLFF